MDNKSFSPLKVRVAILTLFVVTLIGCDLIDSIINPSSAPRIDNVIPGSDPVYAGETVTFTCQMM